MADDEVTPLGTPTTNYGWTKPTVGADVDAWGGMLNADLDGIDSTVKSVSTVANAAYPASNPAGYVTAAAIPAPYVLPTASTSVLGGVKVDGSTITISGGTISGTPSSGPPVTISATAPSSPQAGALWWDSVGGQLYTYYNDGNSSQWVIAVNAAASLLPASTTILGGVKVDGTTIKAAGDGTISTTVVPMGDNRIINGDMRVNQRGVASGTAISVVTVDRWNYFATQAAKGTWGQGSGAGAVIGSLGFPYFLSFASSSAYTPLTTDYFSFSQPIEADAVSDFAWGTTNAQPVALSFWVYSSLTGTFSGTITNYASTRCYPFTFSIPVASTWTKIAVTIPGDTTGTWMMSGNGGALYVQFDLGSGASRRGPAGAWATTTSPGYVGATGAVSVVATNAATFYVTGVKLEIGSVATPYNRQSLAKSMADCQRYFITTQSFVMGGYGLVSTNEYSSVIFPATMRASPTLNYTATGGTNYSTITVTANSAFGFSAGILIVGTGGYIATVNWNANAEL